MTEEKERLRLAHIIQTEWPIYLSAADRMKIVTILCADQPEYLSGCLHPGNEPKNCQYEGKCVSFSCKHHGKTWYGARMTLEAQDPNLLYPKVET